MTSPSRATHSLDDVMLDRLREQLAHGRSVADAEFDRLYPQSIQAVSASWWTPTAVALRAAELLVADRTTRVLDIGSGVGKFCLVGAASTVGTFTGVEHREHLVAVARAAATLLGLPRVRFTHSRFEALDPTEYDAMYFFNPFEENRWELGSQLDATVELSHERFHRELREVQRFLERALPGTRVVTYHGLGGALPGSFELSLREPHRASHLELWVKQETPPSAA